MTGRVSLSLQEKKSWQTKTNCFRLLTCFLIDLPSDATSNQQCKSMAVILKGYGIVAQGLKLRAGEIWPSSKTHDVRVSLCSGVWRRMLHDSRDTFDHTPSCRVHSALWSPFKNNHSWGPHWYENADIRSFLMALFTFLKCYKTANELASKLCASILQLSNCVSGHKNHN
jgi:hypothetical protein